VERSDYGGDEGVDDGRIARSLHKVEMGMRGFFISNRSFTLFWMTMRGGWCVILFA